MPCYSHDWSFEGCLADEVSVAVSIPAQAFLQFHQNVQRIMSLRSQRHHPHQTQMKHVPQVEPFALMRSMIAEFALEGKPVRKSYRPVRYFMCIKLMTDRI